MHAPCLRLLTLLLALLSVALSPLTLAEPPRVGLVLAGGGARGLAHIGVIRYLEEQGIQVNAIAGTSMGSIIGGLYASGLNAREIEDIALKLDWRYALDDSTPRERLPFRRKEQDFDFLIHAGLRFKDGKIRLPLGAIEGQHLNFVLHDLVAHTHRIRDFDRLPIPFRAVAADIVTGEAVEIADGDLALAMRASMSIPGVFTPVEIGEHLLVDGGIAKNIPVDVVLRMGVDRLVVVDIGTPLAPREELDSAVAMINQLTNIMTRSNSDAQLALLREGDVLLKPALDESGVTSTSFDQTELAIRLGYEAARAAGPALASLASPDEIQRTAKRPELKLPVISSIRVETDAPVSRKLLRQMITQQPGEKLDRDRMERDIADIYGLDEFSRVDYSVLKEPEGYQLLVDAKANPQGENILKLGMSWDQDSRGDSDFGLRASWHQRGLNRLGGEWYSAAQLGGLSAFLTQWYQPLDTARLLFADAGYSFEQRQLNLSYNNNLLARAIVDRHHVELAPGYNIGNTARVRTGVYAGTSNADIQVGSPLLSSESENDGGWFAELKADTLDRAYFPGRGLYLRSRYSHGDEDWGAAADYEAWSTSAQYSHSFGANTFSITGRWSQLDIDSSGNREDLVTLASQVFSLGGFQRLSGYTRDSLAGNYLGFASLVYYRRLTSQSILPVDFPVYAGASLEAGNAWFRKEDAAFDDLLHSASVFLGVDSPVGPVYLGFGFGESDQRALYLQIGQVLD